MFRYTRELADIANDLDARRAGNNKYAIKCANPAHDDRNPSAFITQYEDSNLIYGHCSKCGDITDYVLKATNTTRQSSKDPSLKVVDQDQANWSRFTQAIRQSQTDGDTEILRQVHGINDIPNGVFYYHGQQFKGVDLPGIWLGKSGVIYQPELSTQMCASDGAKYSWTKRPTTPDIYEPRHAAQHGRDVTFICEGPSDAVAIAGVGYKAVACFGAHNLDKALAKLPENEIPIVIFDKDPAGISALAKSNYPDTAKHLWEHDPRDIALKQGWQSLQQQLASLIAQAKLPKPPTAEQHEARQKYRVFNDKDLRYKAMQRWQDPDWIVRKLINYNTEFHGTPEKLSVAQGLFIASALIANNSLLSVTSMRLLPLSHSVVVIASAGVGKSPLATAAVEIVQHSLPKRHDKDLVSLIHRQGTPEAITAKMLKTSISRKNNREIQAIRLENVANKSTKHKDNLFESIQEIRTDLAVDLEFLGGYDNSPIHIFHYDEWGHDILKKVRNQGETIKSFLIRANDGTQPLDRDRIGNSEEQNAMVLHRYRAMTFGTTTPPVYTELTEPEDFSEGFGERFHTYYLDRQEASFHVIDPIKEQASIEALDAVKAEFKELGIKWGVNPATDPELKQDPEDLKDYGDYKYVIETKAASELFKSIQVNLRENDLNKGAVTEDEQALIAGAAAKHLTRIVKTAAVIQATLKTSNRDNRIQITAKALAMACIHEEHRIQDMLEARRLIMLNRESKAAKTIMKIMQRQRGTQLTKSRGILRTDLMQKLHLLRPEIGQGLVLLHLKGFITCINPDGEKMEYYQGQDFLTAERYIAQNDGLEWLNSF